MPRGPGTYGSKVGRPPKKLFAGGTAALSAGKKLSKKERQAADEKEYYDERRKELMKRSDLNSGTRKRRSSTQLHADLTSREKARERELRARTGDKGMSGLETRDAARGPALERLLRDRQLISEYGEDAPMARGYGTTARQGDAAAVTRQLEELESGKKKGGKVKKKKSYSRGGKVRGAGKASQGVRKCKYVSMKGS